MRNAARVRAPCPPNPSSKFQEGHHDGPPRDRLAAKHSYCRRAAGLGLLSKVAAEGKTPMSDLQEDVKQKYRDAAKRAASGGTACCGGGAERSGCDPISKDLYTNAEKGALPEKALAASLGCGNPTALAQLQPGETVLDLGSGGGIDVILSAKRVGPTGKAYGLDMTDEM